MEQSSDRTEPTFLTSFNDLHGLAAAGSASRYTAYAVLVRAAAGVTRDGRPFCDLELSDGRKTLGAKIWSEHTRAIETAQKLAPASLVKVLFEVRPYHGAVTLHVHGIREVTEHDTDCDRVALLGEGNDLVADLVCRTLVMDIETAPDTDLRKVPSTVAQSVAKHAERMDADVSKVMSLSPYFGKVVSLAIGDGDLDPSDMPVTVFVVTPPGFDRPLPPWIRAVTEPALLGAFWSLAKRAEVVVTYNGRSFDLPFLVARSLIHRVPVRRDLLSEPFALKPHLDLYRVLTNGGAMTGPSSLDVVCWALGLSSPKEEMDGSMVATAYEKGDLERIATYNAGDVRATTAVYQRLKRDVLDFRREG